LAQIRETEAAMDKQAQKLEKMGGTNGINSTNEGLEGSNFV